MASVVLVMPFSMLTKVSADKEEVAEDAWSKGALKSSGWWLVSWGQRLSVRQQLVCLWSVFRFNFYASILYIVRCLS